MGYKPSLYNFFFEMDGKKFVFNARTGSLVEITPQEFEALNNSLNLPEDSLKALLEEGILVEDEVDELEEIRKRFLEAKKSRQTVWATIALTSACNFACIYCYEKGKKEQNLEFNPTMFQCALNYIKSLISEETKTLILTAYGGEPLLRKNLLEQLINFGKKIKEEGINVNVHIITNGFLIERVEEFLPSNLISLIQITLDGPREIHNKRRVLKNGDPTFDTIYQGLKKIVNSIENTRDILEIVPTIEINITVDKQNVNHLTGLVDKLADDGLLNKDFIFLNFSPVMPTEFYNPGIGPEEVGKKIEEIREYIWKKYGLRNRLTLTYPKPKALYCGCLNEYTVVIDPLGFVYRCWDDVFDPKNAVDHVHPGLRSLYKKRFAHNKKFYDTFDPTTIDPCKDCKYLPLCMGGCMSARKRLGVKCALFEGAQIKYALIESLKNFLKENGY